MILRTSRQPQIPQNLPRHQCQLAELCSTPEVLPKATLLHHKSTKLNVCTGLRYCARSNYASAQHGQPYNELGSVKLSLALYAPLPHRSATCSHRTVRPRPWQTPCAHHDETPGEGSANSPGPARHSTTQWRPGHVASILASMIFAPQQYDMHC
jgi:hypothetical protein